MRSSEQPSCWTYGGWETQAPRRRKVSLAGGSSISRNCYPRETVTAKVAKTSSTDYDPFDANRVLPLGLVRGPMHCPAPQKQTYMFAYDRSKEQWPISGRVLSEGQFRRKQNIVCLFGNYPDYYRTRRKSSASISKSGNKNDLQIIEKHIGEGDPYCPPRSAEQRSTLQGPESNESQIHQLDSACKGLGKELEPLSDVLSLPNSNTRVDPRLEALTKWRSDLFDGMSVIDIGCNAGLLDFTIAGIFSARKVLALDLDVSLIRTCLQTQILLNRNFTSLWESNRNSYGSYRPTPTEDTDLSQGNHSASVKPESACSEASLEGIVRPDTLPNSGSEFVSSQKHDTKVGHQENKLSRAVSALWKVLPHGLWCESESQPRNCDEEVSSVEPAKFPRNIDFKACNVVKGVMPYVAEIDKSSDTSGHLADIVIAFSVSKWIHIQYGDEGICCLFQRVYDRMKNGGLFIFEPQNWKSYVKRRHLCKEVHETIKSITIRPDKFDALLTGGHSNFLFNRIHVVKAGKFTPSQPDCTPKLVETEADRCNHSQVSREIYIYQKQAM